MAVAKSSSGAASNNGKNARRRRDSRSSATTAATRKNLGFVGARRREWGRWAAELRVPRTRKRLWIGTFGTPKEAAHAYDAAIFCFYGARVPRIRKINFPTAPRPDIPEHVRVGLTVANIKAIAEKYALSLADFIPPAPELPAASPEVVVEAAPAPAVGASIGVDAAATTDSGNMSDVGEDCTTIADCLLSFKPEDFDEIMDFAGTD